MTDAVTDDVCMDRGMRERITNWMRRATAVYGKIDAALMVGRAGEH